MSKETSTHRSVESAAASGGDFQPRTDPITFEVLRHRLWQINDEQGRTIINVSGSPVASEVNDFNVALTDATGDLVMLGPYLIHHTGAISVVVRNAIELFGEEIGEGDIYLTNDPWMGALHHNDVCCVAPIHRDGRLIAWTACTVHQIDVGGPVPGSWYLKATDTFQEAPRYRFLKIVRGGETQAEVLETYLTNSRTPSLLELDLRAMIASSNVVKERLAETIERYGVEAVEDTMKDCMDYSELMVRHRLAGIPDGEWYAEDYLDHDGHDERVYAIRLELRKQGDGLQFDYTASDDQAPGFINCTFAGCLAGTLSPVFTQLCSEIPWNQGIIRCLEVVSREGSLNNARFPAPVGMGTISACHHTSNASATVVGKMLACSDVHHERLMANWSGSAYVYNVFGDNQYGTRFGTMLVDSHLGGAGARYIGDGYSTAGTISVPRPSVPNVESIEALYPLLYLYRRRALDSGGAGRFRGGVSGASAMALYGVDTLNVTVSTIGTDHSSAVGNGGGYPGGGATTILVQGTNALERLHRAELELDPTTWGGDYEVLPSKRAFEFSAGDVLVTVPHGGGGFGDPILRDPESVRRDILEGYVSPVWATRVYGVVCDDSPEHRVDAAATEERRLAVRAGRLAGATPAQTTTSAPERSEGERIGETVRRQGADLVCAHCRTPLPGEGHPKARCVEVASELAEAGPWLAPRWKGRSPKFELRQYVCPTCGFLVDAQIRRREEPQAWDDYRVAARPPGRR